MNRVPRRWRFVFIVLLCGVALGGATPAARAQTGADNSKSYYLYNGTDLQKINRDPAQVRYQNWQVWLYPVKVASSVHGRALAYARWGVMDGASASQVLKALAASQRFESAFTRVYGTNAWGPYTFSYPVGPVAIEENPTTKRLVDFPSAVYGLDSRVRSVADELEASLENAATASMASPLTEYFDQARDAEQRVHRLYDQSTRLSGQHTYLQQELVALEQLVDRAESSVPKVRTVLPTVKLPNDTSWMSQTEEGGTEGRLDTSVAEIGGAVWVRQSWSGGDGSMAGTEIVTIMPYEQIGGLEVWTPARSRDPEWIVRIHAANPSGFAESVTSPLRTTATRTFPAVDIKASTEFIYLTFNDPAQAQDAYTYFLYHKQRGH